MGPGPLGTVGPAIHIEQAAGRKLWHEVGALVGSLSVHLLTADEDTSEAAAFLFLAAVDITWEPEKLCYFGTAFFAVQPGRVFTSIMLDREISFCYMEYFNGSFFAGTSLRFFHCLFWLSFIT